MLDLSSIIYLPLGIVNKPVDNSMVKKVLYYGLF